LEGTLDMSSETFAQFIRRISDPALLATYVLPDLPNPPALYRDQNGRGEPYYSLKYWQPGVDGQAAHQVNVYLGALSAEEVAFLERRISKLWAVRGRTLSQTVMPYVPFMRKELAMRRKAIAQARDLALGCGLKLHGFELRRLKRHETGWPAGQMIWLTTLEGKSLVTAKDRSMLLETVFDLLSTAHKLNDSLSSIQLNLLFDLLCSQHFRRGSSAAASPPPLIKRCVHRLLYLNAVGQKLTAACDRVAVELALEEQRP
jgi:hypothetical protein